MSIFKINKEAAEAINKKREQIELMEKIRKAKEDKYATERKYDVREITKDEYEELIKKHNDIIRNLEDEFDRSRGIKK